MQSTKTERDLVIELKQAREKLDGLKEATKAAQAEVNKTENALIEALRACDATSTAKYEGVGSFTRLKPRVYASYLKDRESEVFDFLMSQGREDLIKPSVHPQSLSAFVAEKLEAGTPLPEWITYYSAEGLRFNPKG